MSKHTPGPWEAIFLHMDSCNLDRHGWEIFTPDYGVAAWIERGAPIRKEADAHLIAAAPDLLLALQSACNAIESLPKDALGVAYSDGYAWSIRDELLDTEIRPAIAKAKGES